MRDELGLTKMTIYYFAYGSNMLAERLHRRCSSARLVGQAQLPGHRLSFSKIGRDGSGKATLAASEGPGFHVCGVVFELARDDLIALDRIEGRGRGYERIDGIEVIAGAERQPVCVTTYFAQAGHVDDTLVPFDWYLALVVRGARHAGLPSAYCRQLAATPAQMDPDPDRETRREALAVLAAAGARLPRRG